MRVNLRQVSLKSHRTCSLNSPPGHKVILFHDSAAKEAGKKPALQDCWCGRQPSRARTFFSPNYGALLRSPATSSPGGPRQRDLTNNITSSPVDLGE